ncbi:hypothetical protein [Candidatus Mycoplasma mahonii]|uniref:hypothetical protein n=1 Tax=Candidatus Mycoplasma mahonii TaxID=3004105 RepID=UPI0026EBE18E|nr:hypothetical protein [Candidatus Mycoplasma mahonii]WKX02154.1 hypothetical protein O3I44_02000 [Candidatus Mycoplasma mahonii]
MFLFTSIALIALIITVICFLIGKGNRENKKIDLEEKKFEIEKKKIEKKKIEKKKIEKKKIEKKKNERNL